MNDQNPRQIAARILGKRQTSGEFTESLLESEFSKSKLSAPDRALCQELVYGIVRRQMTLDWLISKKTNGRKQKSALQNLLRLGLYQIFWLTKIPAHAAVHETVELAKRNGFGAQAGFVNAILRGYLREFDATKKILADLKVSNPAIGFSHPQWLVEKWQKRFGDEKLRQLLEWNNTPPKTFTRVNTLKIREGRRAGVPDQNEKSGTATRRPSRDEIAAALLEKWREENVEYDFAVGQASSLSQIQNKDGDRQNLCSADLENLIFELKSHPPLNSLQSFRDGWFYIQDPGTLLAPIELNPQPGETILDLCAAPGGKTTFLAQLMNNTGKIVACDISEERLKLLEENCRRLGVTCVETFQTPHPGLLPVERGEGEKSERVQQPSFAPPKRGEGSRRPDEGKFDKILIDAPCSNSGVLRRRVDLRWRISTQEISRLQKTQLDLLKSAAPKLKSGGVLIYSTCSLEPEENSEVVKEFLAANPNFKLESKRELLPFTDNVDGAFVARLRKTI